MSERRARRAQRFRALHEGEPFLIPNPWDAGSAKVFEALGFEALATTSSGFAFTLGPARRRGDPRRGGRARRALDRATELPLSVDLENGYGPDARGRGAGDRAGGGGRRGRRLDRGLRPGRAASTSSTHAAERVAAAAEAARAARLPVHLHRPGREPHPRQPRPRRHDRPPAGLRGGRRRRALRAGAARRRARSARSARRSSCRSTCSRYRGLTMDEIVEAGAQRVSVGGAPGLGRGRGDGRARRSDARQRRLLLPGRHRPGRGVARRLSRRFVAVAGVAWHREDPLRPDRHRRRPAAGLLAQKAFERVLGP